MQTQVDDIIKDSLGILALKQQAEHVFPLVDYVPESSVLHARKEWVKAVQYLHRHGIEIKPLICPRLLQSRKTLASV